MLEICCGSYYDALQAASGGAGRIELNCALHLGGLTPSLASLELVKEHCNVKVIAMVRPRGGGFCYSEEDFNVMLRECEHLVRHGADGIAFGCLREDASIDRERNARMISIIHSHGKEAVFHRAFDCTSNPYESIETLIELGADRLLTSGLKPKAVEGKALLGALQSCLLYTSHFELIQKEAQGEQVGGSMILVHAEDQLMSAEGFKIIAEEMLASYERIAELEKRLENR